VDGPPLYEGDVVPVRHHGDQLLDDTTHRLVIQDAIHTGRPTSRAALRRRRRAAPIPVWTVDQLVPGEAVTFVFQVTVDNGMGGQEIGGNVAWVISDQIDDPSSRRRLSRPATLSSSASTTYTTCRSSSSTTRRGRAHRLLYPARPQELCERTTGG